MKKFDKKTYFNLTGNEFDELVRENLAPLVKNPARFEDFECIAEFEWNNYALYSANVLKSDYMNDFYKEYDKQEIINSESGECYCLHSLLSFLLENDIIKEGNYLIDPSW